MAKSVNADMKPSAISEISLWAKLREWMAQNWRPILIFLLPFIQRYAGIEPSPIQIDQRNGIESSPNETYRGIEPSSNPTDQRNGIEPSSNPIDQRNGMEPSSNHTDQQNNGEPAKPTENKVHVSRTGGVSTFDDCEDINVNTRYSEAVLRANHTNGPSQMPEGANISVGGLGPAFIGRSVKNITCNESYGYDNINPPDNGNASRKS